MWSDKYAEIRKPTECTLAENDEMDELMKRINSNVVQGDYDNCWRGLGVF